MNHNEEVDWDHDDVPDPPVDQSEEINHWKEEVIDWHPDVFFDPKSDRNDQVNNPSLNRHDEPNESINAKLNKSDNEKEQVHNPCWN